MKRIFAKLILSMLLAVMAAAAWAQDVQLRDDHPEEYVVVRGDTLWDIAGRFLKSPWQWPAIWQANPQIENPHLIYPGDQISLIYVDGKPRLVVNQDNRLTPRVREGELRPIDTIALDGIDEFLRYPRVLTAEQFEALPYVLANEDNKLNSLRGDNIYVRGVEGSVGREFVVARVNFVYEKITRRNGDTKVRNVIRSRWGEHYPHQNQPTSKLRKKTMEWAKRPVEVLGYELWEIARAKLLKTGDPAILQLEGGRREIKPGDLLLPIDSYVYDSHFFPRAMDTIPENMEILAALESVAGVGYPGIVVIGGGHSNGIQAGHTFSAFHPGEVVADYHKYPRGSFARARRLEDANVKLPDEYAGRVMVFRAFDHVSYGIVLEGRRLIRKHDVLKHPDERL